MIPLFSVAQVRKIDEKAIEEFGFHSLILMENAAINIYKTIIEKYNSLTPDSIIGIICGRGNNGGDGFALARHFANNGFTVKVLYLNDSSKFSSDALFNFRLIANKQHYRDKIFLRKYQNESDSAFLNDSTVIIDAMLGSGFTGELKEPYPEIISYINKKNVIRIAIDVPTGLNADTGAGNTIFSADLTVTLGEMKKGLFFGDGYSYSGDVIKGNIGISNHLYDSLQVSEYLIEPEDIAYTFPAKGKNLHKYSAGKVLTIAGSLKYPGAALLTAFSVLKSGAGASVLAFPFSAKEMLNNNYPELVLELYNDDKHGCLISTNIEKLHSRINWADCIGIGPGLGRDERTVTAIELLLQNYPEKKFVIDADAIFALSQIGYNAINLKNSVITPHYGEFSQLINVSLDDLKKDILLWGKEFVKKTKCHLVLKGPRTIIFTPGGEAFINSAGNPGLAKFGNGDVLTGVISGFIPQFEDTENALIASVYLHSLTGDLLKEKYTEFGYTATQLIEALPESIKFLRNSFA